VKTVNQRTSPGGGGDSAGPRHPRQPSPRSARYSMTRSPFGRRIGGTLRLHQFVRRSGATDERRRARLRSTERL